MGMIHRYSIFMVIASILLTGCRKTDPGEWKKYSFPEYGFSVMLPGEPVHETHTVETAFGPLRADLFFFETPSVYYFISVNNLNSIEQKDPEGTLREAQARAESVFAGDVIYSKPIEHQGFPGREFSMEKIMLYKTTYLSRIFIVSDNFFQVSATATSAKRTRDYVDRFFDSFRILAE